MSKKKDKVETLVSSVESNGLDVLISFDTTGSVYSVLSTVRKNIVEEVQELFKLYEGNVRIGVIAHGDYCDKNDPYTIKVLDFTQDEGTICNFVRDIEPTYGGDADECYELVLNTARTVLNWRGGSHKLFIMLGDANPHGVNYTDNKNHIDWKNEVALLNDMNISIYAVHILANFRRSSKAFYKELASKTKGVYLTLDNFGDVLPLINASCIKTYSETKLNEYISVIKEQKLMTRTLQNNFDRLNGVYEETEDDTESYKTYTRRKKSKTKKEISILDGMEIVPAGRFQVIDVDEPLALRDFVTKNGIKFKTGRAFYELTKTEEIQQYKEVIMQNKETGDFYYGSDVRKSLGLLPQCSRSDEYKTEKLKPKKDDDFTVFVQSTSYNRKLKEGSKLLYEIEDYDSEL